jgi:hypothetical protein
VRLYKSASTGKISVDHGFLTSFRLTGSASDSKFNG